MKKLLLLSLLSTAVRAMDQAPEPVAMSDDAPSRFSKQAHQNCCGFCCAATVFAAIECLAWNNSKLHWRYCAVPGNKCTVRGQGLIGLSEGILAAEGLKIGRYLGAKTFELDQRLNARLIMQKEKSE
jgi:hypothetical protein